MCWKDYLSFNGPEQLALLYTGEGVLPSRPKPLSGSLILFRVPLLHPAETNPLSTNRLLAVTLEQKQTTGEGEPKKIAK